VYDKGIGFLYTLILLWRNCMNTRNKNKLRALMLVLKSRKYVVDVISFEGDIISIKIKKI